MRIICDSRETTPLSFPADPRLSEVVRETLPYGDYMIELAEDTPLPVRPPIVWERKSLGDLFGTLGKGYERFRAEILGAKEAGLLLTVLLEDGLKDVWQGYEYSQRSGQEVIQQLFTLQVRYRIPVIFCQGRREAARWIMEYGKAVEREYQQVRKGSERGR